MIHTKEKIGQYVAALNDVAKATCTKAETEKDLSLKGMYLKDAGNFYKIAADLQKGNCEQAAQRAAKLDTAARDEIPKNVWQFLLEQYQNWL